MVTARKVKSAWNQAYSVNSTIHCTPSDCRFKIPYWVSATKNPTTKQQQQKTHNHKKLDYFQIRNNCTSLTLIFGGVTRLESQKSFSAKNMLKYCITIRMQRKRFLNVFIKAIYQLFPADNEILNCDNLISAEFRWANLLLFLRS